MALLKNIQLPNFAVAGYHRVRQVHINADQDTVEIMVGMYVSAEARAAGAPPAYNEYIRIPLSRFEDNLARLAYQVIEVSGDQTFSGAVSDIEPSSEPLVVALKPWPVAEADPEPQPESDPQPESPPEPV